MAEEQKTLFVRAIKGLNLNGDPTTHELQLWERDDTHPNGEVLVAGPEPVEVGDTPAVRLALREQRIEEVSAKEFRAHQQRKQEVFRQALVQDPKMAQQRANDVATMLQQVEDERQALTAEREAFRQEMEAERQKLADQRAKANK